MAPDDEPWVIREVHADDQRDVAALAALRYQWRAVERSEVGLDAVQYERELVQWFSDHASTHVGFLALCGNEPAAMAWLALVDRVPGPGTFVRRCAYVQSVYVLPHFRDQGVGSKLMTALIHRARELQLDYLAVHPSERSFPFYGRLGFDATARVLELDFRPTRTST